MVLLGMYGIIEPTTISTKLGINAHNTPSDWITGIQEEIEEELLLNKHDISTLENDKSKYNIHGSLYNLDNIVEKARWYENGKSSYQTIAEHTIEIEVADFSNSMLQLKNPILDSPTCEPQYTRKFIKFCDKVGSTRTGQNSYVNHVPPIVYDSCDFDQKSSIIRHLSSLLNPHPLQKNILERFTENSLLSLKEIGRLIDAFLVDDHDFWLFDYLINALSSDPEYNAYHVFKMMSIIEMLIINPKQDGKTVNEIEEKLPRFLSPDISCTKGASFSCIMRKLRNKIAHGDLVSVNQLLEQYRHEFMVNYWFDESEYSIENWTYLNIGCYLDKALAEILWTLLSNRPLLNTIQMS